MSEENKIDFKSVKVKFFHKRGFVNKKRFLLEFNFKIRIEDVQIKGLVVTSEEYVKNQLGDLFKASNFEDLLNKTDKFRRNLAKLGCFKTVEAMVDAGFLTLLFTFKLILILIRYFIEGSSKNAYNIIFEVEELGPVGGGIHTSIGNNDGSLVSGIY